jgi:CRISPR-associated protein Csh2
MNNLEKSEILFFYESKYSQPNGDPFTGEQRYDEETKKVLVSDVRIKRFIRDYWNEIGKPIFVINPDPDNKLTAGQRFKQLFEQRNDKSQSAREFAKTLIDIRAFGAVVPIQKDKKSKSENTSNKEDETDAFNITGAVQFAILNPSLNSVDLMPFQNTSTFVSKEGDKQGTIGTSSNVPYALCKIHGWINPATAKKSNLTQDDVNQLFTALWHSINNSNTRSKSNQNSVLLFQIVYSSDNQKYYGTDRLVDINSEKRQEQIRNIGDFEFNFKELQNAAISDKIKEIRYYSEIPAINTAIKAMGEKFKPLTIS